MYCVIKLGNNGRRREGSRNTEKEEERREKKKRLRGEVENIIKNSDTVCYQSHDERRLGCPSKWQPI